MPGGLRNSEEAGMAGADGGGGALVFLSEVRVTQFAFHCNVKAAVWDR